MAFTEDEKVRIRHHLGFLNVQQASVFVLGVPAAVETQFLIEGAMGRVLPQAEAKARSLLDQLDGMEQQIFDDTELLAVTQVDEIGIRQDEYEAILKRYHFFRNGLANVLGVYPNPFDKRFYDATGGGGGNGINVPVRH